MASRMVRASGAIASAISALVFIGIAARSAPAQAQEGNQTIRQIFGLITGDGNGEKNLDGIDYRERPRLVLPPKLDLPPPKAPVSAEANPAWPNDPDVGRVKKLKSEARVPARQVNEVMANPHITQRELERGRTATTSDVKQDACVNSSSPDCLYTPWSILKKASSEKEDKETLKPGEEPTREYLTQPPPGFRRPTQVVRATAEAPKEKEDASDAGAYIRQQGRRKVSVDD